MKMAVTVLLISAPFFYLPHAHAQDEADKSVPAEMEQLKQVNGSVPVGMEVVLVKQNKLVVPVGMKYKKKGDLVVMESAAEYTARRLAGMEERLVRAEELVRQLGDKVDALSKAVEQLQKNATAVADTPQPK